MRKIVMMGDFTIKSLTGTGWGDTYTHSIIVQCCSKDECAELWPLYDKEVEITGKASTPVIPGSVNPGSLEESIKFLEELAGKFLNFKEGQKLIIAANHLRDLKDIRDNNALAEVQAKQEYRDRESNRRG